MIYTCTLDQGAYLRWIAPPVLTDPTAVVFVPTAQSDQQTRDCNTISSVQCADLDFHADLTRISNVDMNGYADLMSTFTFTAKAELNGTMVLCSSTTESIPLSANQSLTVAGKHSTGSRKSLTSTGWDQRFFR